jgi:CheY-like chemotaxis protein
MPAAPTFLVAVDGLDAHHLRLIEIVFRHIRYNRYVFRLAPAGHDEQADLLVLGACDAAARERARRLRERRPGVPVVSVVEAGVAAGTVHAIEFAAFARQLLPILNRVVEIEGLAPAIGRAGRDAAASIGPAAGAPIGAGIPASPAAAVAAPVDAKPAAAAPRRTPRVLIVDEDAGARAQLADAFDGMGLLTESAASGGEALQCLARADVDLATIDVALPDTDGLRLARRIRRDARTRSLPIVVVSGRTSALDVIRGAAAGCSAYLAKPIDLRALRHTVGTQLARALGPDPARWDARLEPAAARLASPGSTG